MSQDKPSRLDVYLQEYDKLKDEQTSRIGFRDNLLYVNLVTIGAVLSFIFSKDAAGGEGPKYVVLLVIPWISIVLGWAYLINDDKISNLGKYFETVLFTAIHKELGEDKEKDQFILGWETCNFTSKRRTRRKIEQLLMDELAFVLPGIISIAAFFRLTPSVDPILQLLSWIELLVVIGLGIEIFLYAEPWKLFKKP
jgi:hypothetical protein